MVLSGVAWYSSRSTTLDRSWPGWSCLGWCGIAPDQQHLIGAGLDGLVWVLAPDQQHLIGAGLDGLVWGGLV